jgi:DNA-binding XRE family transcriptional regulator
MDNEHTWLVSMRKKFGLTQEDVAQALQVTTRTVMNWEHGHNEPKLTIPQTKSLCRLFRINSIEELPDSVFSAVEPESQN